MQFLSFLNVLKSMGCFESLIFLLWVHCFFPLLGFWFCAFLFALFFYATTLFWFVNNLEIAIFFEFVYIIFTYM